jgi:putative hydrolase of the HAD superfamily
MANRTYRGAVLFDAAGTLIELREPVGETYARVARDFGVEQSADRLDIAFRRVFAHAPAMAFPHAESAEVSALERDWWYRCVQETFAMCQTEGEARGHFPTQQHFEQFFGALFSAMGDAAAWRVVDGGLELLSNLRGSGFGIAVVSNFDFRLRALLAALKITPLVDLVILPSDVGAAKPDPALFERAIAELRVARDAAIVVGDHPEQDIAAARNAGLCAVDVGSLATLGDLMRIIEAMEVH